MNKDTSPPVIALFDFDGTLTTRDSLLPFLRFSYGYFKLAQILFSAFPKILKFLFHLTSRQEAKEAILTAAFKGSFPSELAPKAEKFAQTDLKALLKPHALERLSWHQEQGHRCILVSASVSLYLDFWIKEYGPLELLSSRLALDTSGAYTGKLSGKNCWGPEKVSRIEQLVGPLKNYTIYAYGDSRGDQEMLAAANYPYYNRWV